MEQEQIPQSKQSISQKKLKKLKLELATIFFLLLYIEKAP